MAMADLSEIHTTRLLLRQWKPADRAPFAAMNADPKIMRHFPALLSRAESDAMADRCQALIEERSWGSWAVEAKATGSFIGLVGLRVTRRPVAGPPGHHRAAQVLPAHRACGTLAAFEGLSLP